MNIVVLCGGLCPERDVSIVSGRKIAANLIKRGHRVLLMDLFFGYTEPYGDPVSVFTGSLEGMADTVPTSAPDLEAVRSMRGDGGKNVIGPGVFDLCGAADMVFMALHGEDGENGRLQAAFDMAGIRYTGSGYLGSAIAMHKGLSREIFQMNGVQVAPGRVVRPGDSTAEITYPCIVKPCSGGSSVGASVAKTELELEAALDRAFAIEREVLIERFISGREFSVGVMGGRALPIIEICPKAGFYNYENKYQAGMTDEYCPADLSAEDTARIQAAALRVHQILRLEVYSRVDFILAPDGELYCLEANTLPGMTPLSLLPQEAAADGLDYPALCEEIIRLSMEKYV